MSESIELRSDLSAASGIRGVGQTPAPRPDKAGKKFAQELERRLSRKENKEGAEPGEDEIIIGDDASRKEKDADDTQDEKEKPRKDASPADRSPGKINIIV